MLNLLKGGCRVGPWPLIQQRMDSLLMIRSWPPFGLWKGSFLAFSWSETTKLLATRSLLDPGKNIIRTASSCTEKLIPWLVKWAFTSTRPQLRFWVWESRVLKDRFLVKVFDMRILSTTVVLVPVRDVRYACFILLGRSRPRTFDGVL